MTDPTEAISRKNLDPEGRWRTVTLPIPEDNTYVERVETDGSRLGFYPGLDGISILLHDDHGDRVMTHTIPWSELQQLEYAVAWLRSRCP